MKEVMRYYGNDTVPLANFPFNFFLMDSLMNRTVVTGESLKETVSLWLDNLPPNKWPNWVVSLHSLSMFLTAGWCNLQYSVRELVMLLGMTGIIVYKSISMNIKQWIRISKIHHQN